MHKLIIAGRVTHDAQLRNTNSGDAVLGFSVAVDNGKDKQGNKRPATFFDCSLWGTRAQALAPYITKGLSLAVEGRVSAREHNGKAYLQCNVSDLTMLGGGQRNDGQRDNQGYNQPQDGYGAGGYGGGFDDDVPFAMEWRI